PHPEDVLVIARLLAIEPQCRVGDRARAGRSLDRPRLAHADAILVARRRPPNLDWILYGCPGVPRLAVAGWTPAADTRLAPIDLGCHLEPGRCPGLAGSGFHLLVGQGP